jgi:hypothetical protein
MALGRAKDRSGHRFIADRARQADRAHPHHRHRESVVVIEAGLFLRSRDELADLLTEHRLHRLVTTRCVSGEGRRRTSAFGIGDVGEREVAVHHAFELLAAAGVSAGTEQRLDLMDESLVERRLDERVLVLEMRVEPSAGEAGLVHQRIDADPMRAFGAQES